MSSFSRSSRPGARASLTFSPANPSHTNDTRSQDAPQVLLFQTLSGLNDATIILSTKTGQRYEGVISSTSPEGDTAGVTLKDVKEVSKPGTPLKDTLFIASTNIENWQFGAADAKLRDTFQTDTDINKGKTTQERESQVLQPSDSQASPDAPTAHRERLGDEVTIRPAATNNTSWAKQTSVVTTSFDGEGYTSKLDKSAADLKERARKGQRMASEIMGSTTNNPHIAEERNLNVDDSGVNKEDRCFFLRSSYPRAYGVT
ncbi:LsmAD domain containing protein [Tylopilus felleus]